MRAACSAPLTAALLALAPAAAQGGDPPPQIAIRLSYHLGPGSRSCPPEQTLHDEVARRMGYDPFTPDAADHVVTTLSLSARSSHATVEFYDTTGDHRWDDKTLTLPDNNCMALVTGVAIYISYMFAPFVRSPTAAPITATPECPPPSPPAEVPASPPTAAPAPPPAPPLIPAPPPLTLPSSPRRRSWLVEIGMSPFVAIGIAPGIAFGGALHVGLRWPSMPLSIAAELHLDGSLPGAVGAPHPTQMETFQTGGAVVPCWRPLFFLICGVATVSEVLTESAEISAPKGASNTAFRVGARVGVEAPMRDPFSLRMYGDILGTIRPARASLGGTHAWSTPPISGAVGVAILWFF